MDNTESTLFSSYVRLYTLHRVERLADLIVLRVRIQTLRYSFAPLGSMPLDAAYAYDPREGVEMVRAAVLPRLQHLLDSPEPFRDLKLLEDQQAWWRRYAAERGLPADTVRPPAIHVPTPAKRLTARSRTAERLAQAQQTLELIQTAATTLSTLAAAWQNWQIGREKRKMLETQRLLLQDAIQAQLEGQGRALDHALDQSFVRGYLADHAGDRAADIIFGDTEE